MRTGFAISLAMHGAILFWAIGAFSGARDVEAPETQPIPVDIVSASEMTRIKAGVPDAENEEPAAAEAPEETSSAEEEAETERPEPQRESEPEPAPETAEPAPKPREEKTETASAEPEEAAGEAPSPPMPGRKPAQAPQNTEPLKRESEVAEKPEPEKEREEAESRPEEERDPSPEPEKKREFNTDRIAALLDKRPDAGPRRAASADQPADEPEQPGRGSDEGQDMRMSLSEIDALRQRISQCWNPPVGGLGAESIRVKLRLRLDREGMLDGRPEVMNAGESSFSRAAADSAVRAVMLCQPYDLPTEKYALWQDMILNFDPREMFGG